MSTPIEFKSSNSVTKDDHLYTKFTYENSVVEKDANGKFIVTQLLVTMNSKLI